MIMAWRRNIDLEKLFIGKVDHANLIYLVKSGVVKTHKLDGKRKGINYRNL